MLQASSRLVSVFLDMQNGAVSPLPAALAARAATAAGQDAPAPPLNLVAGQTVSAAILTRLAPQLYLASIDGNDIQLKLPVRAEPGDRLSLRVQKAAPDYVLQLLPAASPTPGVSTSLSAGAQIVQLVLSEATAAETRATPRTAAAPLLGAPPKAASASPELQLAAGMRKAVSQSGIFYESHLANWAQGRQPLASLRAEPQGTWTPTEPRTSTTGSDQSLRGDLQGASMTATSLTDEARAMLRQQLTVLETREFSWQGLVWPGQVAALRIREEEPERKPDPQDLQAQTWRTTLCVPLAGLGELRVNLTSCGDSVSAAMSVDTVAAAETLYAGLPQLEERLLCAGLKPASLKVVSDG